MSHDHRWFSVAFIGWTCCLGCMWQLRWLDSAEIRALKIGNKRACASTSEASNE